MAEPIRMCSGCRAHRPKKELLRVLRTPEGTVVLDASAKASGRGAYLCRDPECLKKARKSRSIERILGVSLPPQAYDALAASMEGDL